MKYGETKRNKNGNKKRQIHLWGQLYSLKMSKSISYKNEERIFKC